MTVCGKVNQHSNAFSKQPRLREVLQKVRPPVGARVLQRCNSQIFTVHRFPGVALTQTGAMVVLVAITKGAKLTDPHWSRIRLVNCSILQHAASGAKHGQTHCSTSPALVLFHDEAPVFAQLVMQSLTSSNRKLLISRQMSPGLVGIW